MWVHPREIIFGVVHVLTGFDLVELSLAILDFELISRAKVLVLAEVGTNKRRVVSSNEPVESILIHFGEGDDGKESPAKSPLPYSSITKDSLNSEPVPGEPYIALFALVSIVHTVKVLTVCYRDVV